MGRVSQSSSALRGFSCYSEWTHTYVHIGSTGWSQWIFFNKEHMKLRRQMAEGCVRNMSREGMGWIWSKHIICMYKILKQQQNSQIIKIIQSSFSPTLFPTMISIFMLHTVTNVTIFLISVLMPGIHSSLFLTV